ncbi:response regulator [Candidatus Nitronereus thalassa]|uniref:histidine kinase n=1 Tax=Candidatus Nitronereus thalassa TaxID=3020898 RepID=A0ABU3K662_9BACT|nr:response regulator [Candidatus Nitronereus thalassa]MDT7041859.1 response regulator [Candidatus Nitronereus thalassa]
MSRILIVHHDSVQRHFLSSLLQHQGWEIVVSADAEDACRVLQGEGSIDVMVIDLRLPGVSGWEFCRMLRRGYQARFANIPILCLSSSLSTMEGERVTAFLGGQAFLPLPLDPASLTQSLVQILEGKTLLAPFRVQVIGEETEWLTSLSRMFQRNGWSVGESQGVPEPCWQEAGDSPDLIVGHHPFAGCWSLDWVADFKGHAPNAKIFVVTDDPNPELALESLQYGADEFIREPVDPKYLDELLVKAERTRVGNLFSGEWSTSSALSKPGDEEFKKFLHEFDEVVILTDGEGKIVDLNPQGCRQLSWSGSELCGHSLVMLEPSVPLDWWSSNQNGHGSREACFRTRGGSTLKVMVTTYPVCWSEGVRFVLVAKNVQELSELRMEVQRMQEQVRQFQEIESIGNLAGGIAHDVNNILTAIQGHASLLTYKDSSDAATQKPAEVIRQAAHRGQELTAQLLGAARRGKERRTSINVHDAIDEVLALLSGDRTKSIQIMKALVARDPWIGVNARQLHQVLLNLMVNACDAMPNGGTLQISTDSFRPHDPAYSQNSSFHDSPYLEIIVKDSGCGISAELAETVFEPFFTTKPPSRGSGMGLAIVKEIVESYGGHISLSSEPHKGSAFHLYFPQHPSPPSSLIHLPTLLKKPHPRVLVVDDEHLVADTTVEMLRHLECETCVAYSGEEALTCYQGHAHEIDVVLLDLTMTTMSGENCFRTLQTINPSLKVVFSSGGEVPYSVQQLCDEGLAGFVQKPFDVEDLSLALTQACVPDREGQQYALSGCSPGTKEDV